MKCQTWKSSIWSEIRGLLLDLRDSSACAESNMADTMAVQIYYAHDLKMTF